MDTTRAANVKTEYSDLLASGIAAGIIYNSDFTQVKDMLGRAYQTEWEKTLDTLGDGIRKVFYDNDVETMFPNLHTIKTLRRKFDKAKALAPEEAEGFAVMDTLLTSWETVAALMSEAKPLIVKTRKPSETPRKTTERTLENTGTCPVCGQNVKLEKGGRLYSHGYTLQWNFRNGNCFAVGLQPWEQSPDGAIQYTNALKERLQAVSRVVASQYTILTVEDKSRPVKKGLEYPKLTRGDLGFDRALKIYIANLESEMRNLTRTIADFEKRIAEWQEQPLPGEGANL